jgi:hypothetical protein
MSDTTKIVQMALVNPGETATNGEFTFALQPRFNPARTVQFELVPSDAETLHKALGSYLRAVKKASA